MLLQGQRRELHAEEHSKNNKTDKHLKDNFNFALPVFHQDDVMKQEGTNCVDE